MFTPQDRSKNKPHSANLVRRSGLASIGFRVSRLRTVYGARAAHIQPLQNVLNGAARLILHKRKYDHITSDIRDRLHWLPIQHRLEYKICLLIFKFLHQKAPVYLAVMSDPVSASAIAEVISDRQHAAPRSRTTTYGQRSFSVSGPSLWNSLPLSVRDPSLTMTQFCTHLNTFLFCRTYCI